MSKRAFLLILIILLITVPGSSGQKSTDSKNRCKRSELATAEPGTCLHPSALRILKAIDRIQANPLKQDKERAWLRLLEPGVHKVIDTVVVYNDITVPLRIYYPDRASLQETRPILFYVHGGAFMYGSIEEYDMLAKKLSLTTGCIVTSVDYRLAPEYPFPAAIDDSYAALKWVVEHAEWIGGEREDVCVMGSSAGGNIATVLTLKSRDEAGPPIACQILFYPSTTFMETEFPSRIYFMRDSTRSYMLTEKIAQQAGESYMGTHTNPANPYLSPLEANLTPDLPPALICTAQCDPLRDEGRLYAERLQEQGVPVTRIEYEGMIHGFLSFYMVLKEGKKGMKEAATFIQLHTGE